MDQGHLEDLAAAFALKALTPEEYETAAAHLAACETCRAQVAEFRRTIDVLPLAAPSASPAEALRRRIIAAARDDVDALGALKRKPARLTSISLWRPALGWAAFVAAAIIIGAFGLYGANQATKVAFMQRLMIEMQSQSAVRENQEKMGHAVMVAVAKGMYWTLPPMERGKMRCAILQPPHERSAMLLGSFPKAPHDMQWHVWVIHRGVVHSGGMIHPGTAMMHMPMPVYSGDQIAFTMDHPNAMGALPTSPFMMRVTLD